MTIISMPDLTSYPGVKIRSSDTAALVIELVNGLVGDIGPDDNKLGALSPVPTKARTIALKVAARALRNPEGAESITTGLDDWKKTIRYRDFDPGEAGVYLNDAESEQLWELVRPRPKRRARSIRLVVPGYASRC